MLKRVGTIVLAVVLVMVMLAGCGNRQASQAEIEPEALVTEIMDKVTFEGEMMQLEEGPFQNYYLALNMDEVGDKISYLAYLSEDLAKADELAVFKAEDADTLAKIKTAVEDRLNDKKISFENYRPDQMDKINHAVIITEGNYLVFCVTNDYSNAETVINEALK